MYIISEDPVECAMFLDKNRSLKMIYLSAQMLNAAILKYNGPSPLFKIKNTSADLKHNSWTSKTRSNYRWMCLYFVTLCNRYEFYYKKKHKYFVLYEWFLKECVHFIPIGQLTNFCDYMSNECFFAINKKRLEEQWVKDIVRKKNRFLKTKEKNLIDAVSKTVVL